MTVTYSTFDSLQGSFYPLSFKTDYPMILTSIPSWATPPESHPGSLKSHPQSQLIPLRFDWILMLCASLILTSVYQSQHLIHIWHSPFAALPQSERIFCASYSHLWSHTAYYHLTVTIATFYSYHFMVYLTHPAHTATLRLELNALFAFLPRKTPPVITSHN